MIHGAKRTKKEKTEQESKDQEQLSNKINLKLGDFFAISRTAIKLQQVPTYLQFTSLLMQLCSDIPSIFNFRRQLITLTLLSTPQPNQPPIYSTQIKLTTKLIQSNPKSYTIWSYRQWLVLGMYQLDKGVLGKEKQLCKGLLGKDQKNFHVWNYRCWVNSVCCQIDQEIRFTEDKIKLNPFNFSPYHFRSKFIIQKYNDKLFSQLDQVTRKQIISYEFIQKSNYKLFSQLDQVTRKQIISYGMPLKQLQSQLQSIKTAIFLNPNQQAPWLYYNWLLGQLVPAFVVRKQQKEDCTLYYFNLKVCDFKDLLYPAVGITLEAVKGNMSSDVWILKSQDQPIFIRSNLDKHAAIRLENTGRLFLGQKVNKQLIKDIKAIIHKQVNFLDEVIESQQGKCRFVWTQKAQLYKLMLLLGTCPTEWCQIISKGLSSLKHIAHQPKNNKYIQKQIQYWQRLQNDTQLTPTQHGLKNMYTQQY